MKKNILIILYSICFLGIITTSVLLLLTATEIFGPLPSIEELENPQSDLATEVLANDGSLIGKFYIKDRIPVPYNKISKNLIYGLIATEDERFFDHSGIDFYALLRALSGIITFQNKGGASTISQQLAYNLLTEVYNNYHRSRNPMVRIYQKLKEWIVAIRLERNFTKEEIISFYFNTVPFGQNTYGVRNACQIFFRKLPSEVNIHEAALLIGLLKGNTIYNPLRNPLLALHRRNIVIDQLEKNKYISPTIANHEKRQALNLNYQKLDELSGIAQHFREELRKSVKNICSKLRKPTGKSYDIYKDGLRIYTTIDPTIQNYAEKAFKKQILFLQKAFFRKSLNRLKDTIWSTFRYVLDNAMRNNNRWKKLASQGLNEEEITEVFMEPIKMTIYDWKKNSAKDTIMSPLDSIKYHKQIIQGGILAMDPLTGEIKAWVGGNNFSFFKYDHVNISTKRQIGSAIKPLLYSLALSDLGYNSQTLCPNTPQCFPKFDNWCSHNDNYKQTKFATLEKGLIHSYNNVSAYLIKLLSPKRFAEFLKQCNISSTIPYVPSIALGTPEISLFEATWAYSMFPGEGYSVKPYYIKRIEDKEGNIIASFISEKNQIINENDARTIVDILRKATHYGTSYQLRSKYNLDFAVAGKTGTTNKNSDAWFLGFSPEILCGVWVGFDDKFISLKTYEGYGAQAAMPIFANLMQQIYNDEDLGYSKEFTFTRPNNNFPATTNKENDKSKPKKRTDINKRLEKYRKKSKKNIKFDK